MSGPWEQYQTQAQPTQADGPWTQYAAPASDGFSAARMIGNIPKSAGEFVGGIAHAVAHPVDTVSNLGQLFVGAAQNAAPEFLQSVSAAPQRQMASAVGNFFKDRYGSKEGFLKALENDPVGILSDASMVLTGGAGMAAKVPVLGKALDTAAMVTNPIRVAEKAGAVVAPVLRGGADLAGKITTGVVGAATHTGGDSIRAAYQAGKAGGAKAAAFTENLRGNAPLDEVVTQAKDALANLRAERGAAYRGGMAGVSADKTVLDFAPIDQAFSRVKSVGTYKGKSIRENAVAVQDQIDSKLAEWRKADPAEFHTPEGLDALKQAIGDIRDGTQFGTPGRKVADSVYNAVKNEITKQAPQYAKVMKDYEEGSRLISEVERSLSLGNKASADTALRKLQSVLRSGVNTNFGKRLDMARQLEQAGAPNLTSAIAGQSLNQFAPRGLGAVAAAPNAGTVAFLAGNPLAAIPALAMQSPRLMGEAAYGAGALRRGVGALSRNALSQAGGLVPRRVNALAQRVRPEVAGLVLSEAGQRRR